MKAADGNLVATAVVDGQSNQGSSFTRSGNNSAFLKSLQSRNQVNAEAAASSSVSFPPATQSYDVDSKSEFGSVPRNFDVPTSHSSSSGHPCATEHDAVGKLPLFTRFGSLSQGSGSALEKIRAQLATQAFEAKKL